MPCAKLTEQGNYSIISDYLGTPKQAYDEKGNLVWERELDIYGQTRKEKGISNFVPFRYQGQYYDEETNLCYNRFRYYNPESGTYISKDPIGLKGGLNVYAYVKDVNKFVDIFGLDYFYQLMKDNKVVYNGITKNPIQNRIRDHIDVKDFTEFRYIEVDNKTASRNLEGSALYNAQGQGLQNATRLDGKYYHSYDPNNLASGRTYYSQSEIDEIMKKSDTGKIVDKKVKLCKT